ncbi:restriction endonuclease subunit R [Coleofasciculus sp.]|uniref:restriction endonuclease subunit R n=1 Tax=Coleofasciculus sp. TaxID=3100458 RepID=UPI003A389FEF
MVLTVQALVIPIDELEQRFGLVEVEDTQFFQEWQNNLPELSDIEKQMLDKLKRGYFNLLKHPPLLENAIRMAVIAPLLFLADFYLFPFHIKAEKSVDISTEDEGLIVEGRLDVLVLKQHLWVAVIESKRAAYSIEAGLSQMLAYMLANPHPKQPSFGMISNGGSFLFIKLIQGQIPQYATSSQFDLRRKPGNDLYNVLSILKHLGELTQTNSN